MTLDAVFHWLHLLAAAVWVGGSLAVAYAVQPALRETLGPVDRLKVYRVLGARFTHLQWGCWAVLLFTGLHKLWGLRETPDVFLGPFGRILGVKLCLVAAMVCLTLAHGKVWGKRLLSLRPGEPGYAETVARMAFWGRVNAGVLVLIVGCGVLMRYNPW